MQTKTGCTDESPYTLYLFASPGFPEAFMNSPSFFPDAVYNRFSLIFFKMMILFDLVCSFVIDEYDVCQTDCSTSQFIPCQ